VDLPAAPSAPRQRWHSHLPKATVAQPLLAVRTPPHPRPHRRRNPIRPRRASRSQAFTLHASSPRPRWHSHSWLCALRHTPARTAAATPSVHAGLPAARPSRCMPPPQGNGGTATLGCAHSASSPPSPSPHHSIATSASQGWTLHPTPISVSATPTSAPGPQPAASPSWAAAPTSPQPASRGGRAALPAGKIGAKGGEPGPPEPASGSGVVVNPQGQTRQWRVCAPGKRIRRGPSSPAAKPRSAGLGLRGPQAGVSTSGTRGAPARRCYSRAGQPRRGPRPPLTFANISVHQLTVGQRFNFSTWTGGGARYSLSVVAGVIHSTRSRGAIY